MDKQKELQEQTKCLDSCTPYLDSTFIEHNTNIAKTSIVNEYLSNRY